MRPALRIPPEEVTLSAVRSQGAGGQNVNKVSSAVHLRFDIRASSLPDDVKQRLLALNDQRITRDGVLVIKAQTQRSQEVNRVRGTAAPARAGRQRGVAAAPARARPGRRSHRSAGVSKARKCEPASRPTAPRSWTSVRASRPPARLAPPEPLQCGMAKDKSIYTCTECGGTSAEVAGQVPALRRLEHAGRERSPKRRAEAPLPDARRRRAAGGARSSEIEAADVDRAADRPRRARSRARRRHRRRRRGADRRRSGHRQVDAAAAGARRAVARTLQGAVRHRRGDRRAGRAARAPARPRRRAGARAGRDPARDDRRRRSTPSSPRSCVIDSIQTRLHRAAARRRPARSRRCANARRS